MKINQQSSIYFVSFFTFVIFGFILFLYAINNFLAEKIENSKTQEITNLLDKNMPCDNYQLTTIDNTNFYYCKNERIIAKHAFSDFAYADKIEYLVFLNITKLNVNHIEIINHKETPGLGDKITNQEWLKTLYYKAARLLKLKTDGGQIDSFTAASLTPRTFLKSLETDLKWLKNNQTNIINTIQG